MSNLLEIRKQFIKVSGRYDLVIDSNTFTDNGADHYILQGQRALERRINFSPATAKVYQDLAVGTYLVQFKNCRAVREVWVMNADARTQLIKLNAYDLMAIHKKYLDNAYTTPLSSMTPGTPLYYYPTNLRRSPDEDDFLTLGVSDDSTTLQSYLDTVSPADPAYTGLIIFPPTDEAFSIEISGLFYSTELSDDTDSNYWSANYPNLLVMAALQQLEIFYHGSKRTADWEAIIESEIRQMDMDSVEQECSDIDQLEG